MQEHVLKIASWNVNSIKVRLDQILQWLKDSNCDILALQELKLANEHFPEKIFNELGYYCAFNGQKTYNGVAIISKLPFDEIACDIPNYVDINKRVIRVSINSLKLNIVCVYVVNGESLQSDKFQYKLSWLDALKNYISSLLEASKNNLTQCNQLIVLGDFNIAPDDKDVYDPTIWQDSILCSKMERNKWQDLLQLGLLDSFRLFNNDAKNYTWWDYRNMAFRRNLGLRIDHILINHDLQTKLIDCQIDKNPRRNIRASDHTPIILSLLMTP